MQNLFFVRYENEFYSTVCPTRYRTRHLFNNSNTNEDIATKFEQKYVRCVRNEKKCVCSAPKGPATQNAVCRSGLRSLSAAECYILSRLF